MSNDTREALAARDTSKPAQVKPLTDEQQSALRMVLWHYAGDDRVKCLSDLLGIKAAP